MEKIKKVRIPAQPEKIIDKTLYICDLCGREGLQSNMFRECSLCGRLVCWTNSSRKDCSEWDPEDLCDYPDDYCKSCYSLKYKKYRKERSDMEARHYLEEKKFDAKIKKESLNET